MNIIPESKKGIKFMKVLLVLLLLVVIVECLFSEGKERSVKRSANTQVNGIKTENTTGSPIELAHNKEETLPSIKENYFIVSTVEGDIHAYEAGSNKQLWTINLGKPLVSQNVEYTRNLFDQNILIPGRDGHLYFYSEERSLVEKIDIPLKTLIDRTPFSFPGIHNYLFLGDKTTSMFTIDVDRGEILSNYTHGGESRLQTRSVSGNVDNVITVIRIDYTLICMNKESGAQSWNATVSEVMAIQKSTKSEITFQGSIGDQLMDRSAESPISSIVQKYQEKTSPVKIINLDVYAGDKEVIDIIDDKDENTNKNSQKNFYNRFSDHVYEDLKWAKEKLKNSCKFIRTYTFLHFLIFKFWELYYFEDYFLIYMTTIFFLMIAIIILFTIVIKVARKNFALKNQIRKLSDEKKNLTALASIPWINSGGSRRRGTSDLSEESVEPGREKGRDMLSFRNEFEIKEQEEDNLSEVNNDPPVLNKNSTALALYNQKSIKTESDLKIEDGVVTEYIDENHLLSYPNNNLEKFTRNLVELQRNKLIDLGLQHHQKETMTKTDLKIYQDVNGSFIQEENHTIITKYENNSEVEEKVNLLRTQVNEIKKAFNSGEDNRGDLEFKWIVKRTKEETQTMIIDNKADSEIDTIQKGVAEVESSNAEKSVNNQNNQNTISLRRSITPQKHKRNIKEYCIINHEKINTTHIDEGRLDKTFEEIEKIGQGGFGCVFKARHKIDGSYYAIKMIELKVRLNQSLMEHKVIKEVRTMMKLSHKNVVRYTTCWFQLKVDSIQGMIDVSKVTSEAVTESIVSRTKNNNSISRSYTYNYSRRINHPYNKGVLGEITENDEKSSVKSGFNWSESESQVSTTNKDLIENRGNIIKDINLNQDKALSLSIERDEDNFSSEDEMESSRDNNRNKHALDDSYNYNYKDIGNKREPTYNVYFFMQMEFCDGLPLNLFLENNKEKGLDRKLIFSFFKQIVSGVNHIHKNNVIHRDLKPHNIFIFGKNSLKIGDFGLATEMNSREKLKTSVNMSTVNYTQNNTFDSVKFSEFVGTPLYQSPEQVEGLHYNQKVDIFAMGLILYEMCSAFKTGMERRENLEKLKNEHTISEYINHNFPLESHLILWMTNKKPSERPTAQEIQESEVFSKLKSEQE